MCGTAIWYPDDSPEKEAALRNLPTQEVIDAVQQRLNSPSTLRSLPSFTVDELEAELIRRGASAEDYVRYTVTAMYQLAQGSSGFVTLKGGD